MDDVIIIEDDALARETYFGGKFTHGVQTAAKPLDVERQCSILCIAIAGIIWSHHGDLCAEFDCCACLEPVDTFKQ